MTKLLVVWIMLLCLPGEVNSATADIFFGGNPYDWDDPKCILYDYKGFFNPMIDLVKSKTTTDWTWSAALTVNVETIPQNKESISRTIKPGPTMKKVFEMQDGGNLYGIMGVSTTTEGAYGSEITNVTYIHTYTDSAKSTLLEAQGLLKSKNFAQTIRLGPTVSSIANGILDFFDWMDYMRKSTHVTFKVFHETSFGSEKIAQSLRILAKARHSHWNADLTSFESDVLSGATKDSDYFFRERISKTDFFNRTCTDTLTKARAVVVIGSVGFIRQVAISLSKAATENGVNFDNYFIVAVPATLWPLPSHKASDMIKLRQDYVFAEDDAIAEAAFKNMIVFVEEFDTKVFEELSTTVKGDFYKEPAHLANTPWTANRPVPLWSGYTYDAMLLFMMALNKGIAASDVYTYLIDNEWGATDFFGLKPFSGTIKINKYGDREWTINVMQLGKRWTKIGDLKYGVPNYIPSRAVAWPKEADVSPLQLSPDCGYAGCKGMTPAQKKLIMTIVWVIVGVVVFVGLLVVVWFQLQQQEEIIDMNWKVNFDDLKDVDPTHHDDKSSGYDSEGEEGQGQFGLVRTASLESITIADGGISMIDETTRVFRKPLVCEFFKNVEFNMELMKELGYLKELNNDMIVHQLGLTMEKSTGSYWMVQEYCGKGSLKNILEDEKWELDSNLKLSMIEDIATGMAYLHFKTRFGSHGNLKTSNVLVTDNFTCKISDFGYSVFISDMKRAYCHSEVEYKKRMLWRAPELLRRKYNDIGGTKEGDSFSFAIIVHEIINRHGPWNLLALDNVENARSIIGKVKETRKDHMDETWQPFRPRFERVRNRPLKRMANYCKSSLWHENPELRHGFRRIVPKIRAINPARRKQTSFLDRALKRMEKYSDSLRDKAEAKLEELQDESTKLDELTQIFVPRKFFMVEEGDEDLLITDRKPELIPDTSVVVVELNGMTDAIARIGLRQVLEVENQFRNTMEAILRIEGKEEFFIGQGDLLSRFVISSRVLAKEVSKHTGTVEIVKGLMETMKESVPEKSGISLRAGMHNGTINTGLIGNGEESLLKFEFHGVKGHAEKLCDLCQDFEMLVSPEAHKAIQKENDIDVVLDWGAKRQYEQSGEIHDAFCLKF